MDIWYTADQHFDHGAIIQYCDRPFPFDPDSIKDTLRAIMRMNEHIIEEHNKLVKPNDEVWHVGDFTMRGRDYGKLVRKRFIRPLHGVKHLIYGNHDRFGIREYIDMGFTSVHSSYHQELLDIYLVHDPVAAITRKDRLWLCGHVHDLFKTAEVGSGRIAGRNVINVGVDVWNFRPVHLDEIIQLGKELGF